jgi:hypothetical protein
LARGKRISDKSYLAQRRKDANVGDRTTTESFTEGNGDNRDEIRKLRFLCSLLLKEVSLRAWRALREIFWLLVAALPRWVSVVKIDLEGFKDDNSW